MKLSKSIFAAAPLLLAAGSFAQSGLDSVSGATAVADAATAQAVSSYWTEERMANAKARSVSVVVTADSLSPSSSLDRSGGLTATPGFARGCAPGGTACDTSPQTLSNAELAALATAAYGDLIQPMHGAKPVNPRDGPYGPFQRWREAGSITAYPKSTVGKYFFTLNGLNYVCSASVINASTLITAGHCNSDGSGTFATNRLFCPSWNNGASSRGCWVVADSKTAAGWHVGGNPDNDYACLITSPTGQVIANKVGNVTGWLGRAWNFPASQAERTFGYPQAAPFNGRYLQTTASTEWYTHDFVAGGQVSKIIGSDLTGGSSGGPWILGWTGTAAETADTDGSGVTDPGSNWVNGVNSHKRCVANCNSPPTTTAGVFWQEMTSPPFMNTAAADETEDIIAVCFANGGT